MTNILKLEMQVFSNEMTPKGNISECGTSKFQIFTGHSDVKPIEPGDVNTTFDEEEDADRRKGREDADADSV